MKYIEIYCIDKTLAKKVVIELERELKNLSLLVKGVNPDECLLSEALKVIKTYPQIKMDKNSLMFLESARENQVQEELVEPIKSQYDFIIKSGSYITELLWLYTDALSKKLVLKYLLKKFSKKPDNIIYLEIDLRQYLKRRKIMESSYRLEDNLKGKSAVSRFKKYPKILQKINLKYGTNVSIIKTEDNPNDLSHIVNLAIKEILYDQDPERTNN